MTDTDNVVHLIAKVLAWQDGYEADRIDAIARNAWWRDEAAKCARDLGLVTDD